MSKILILTRLNILAVYRDQSFYTNTLPKFLVVAFIYLQAMYYVFLFLDNNSGPLALGGLVRELINKYWLTLFALDLGLRILFRTITNPVIPPFNVLPLQKETIIRFVHWKSVVNHFNLIWILMIIPLLVGEQSGGLMLLDYFSWILLVLLLDYVAVIAKLMVHRSAAMVISIIFMLIFWGIISLSIPGWSFMSGMSEGNSGMLILLISSVIVLDLVVVRAYLYRYFHPESNFTIETRQGKNKSLELYLPYTLLIYKSIVRNSRPRSMLFSTMLVIILSWVLIVKTSDNQSLITYYFLTCLNGAAAFSIGYHLFSIDMGIYPFLHASETSITGYISAKYWLLTLFTLVCSSVCIPVLAENIPDLIRFLGNVSMVLGVCNPLILLVGIQFSQRMDLSRNSFANAQGSNVLQMVCLVLISVLPVGILIMVSHMVSRSYVDYLIMATGLVLFGLNRIYIKGFLSLVYNSVKYEKMQSYS